MRAFRDLGDRVATAAERAHYNEDAFASIAAEALEAAEVHKHISTQDVVDWVLRARQLPEQHDLGARFGSPPVSVYAHPRFFIQVLFWRDGETSTHRHAFTGAFTVIEGESLQTRHTFEETACINSRLRLGALDLRDANQIRPGDVTRIDNELIHCVYHLAQPTVSVVVRTTGEPTGQPQFSYRWPGVASDPFYSPPLTSRKVQFLLGQHTLTPRSTREHLLNIVRTSDLAEIWGIGSALATNGAFFPHVWALGGVLGERFGETGSLLAAALRETTRIAALSRTRRAVRDPDYSWWLAALILAPDRTALRQMVELRWPGRVFDDFAQEQIANMTPLLGVDFDAPDNVFLCRLLLREEEAGAVADAYANQVVDTQKLEQIGRKVSGLYSSVASPAFFASSASRRRAVLSS